ncbi:MAG: hypothetical protein ACI8VE_000321 [Natrialbaceae archaeon]|jgi:hypothetical protein
MTDEDVDTERSVVKTYVPAYQKALWQRQAETLEMSQSEFVRTMVQAGRRGFDGFEDEQTSTRESTEEVEFAADTEESQKAGTEPQRIDEHLVNELSPGEHRSWEELRDALAEELVDEPLEDALQRLQRKNRVQYSGRHGGYTVVNEQ